MPNSPKLACILLWYPLFTQPFIFREIEGLKKLLPTTIYTLYGRNLKHCSSEMKAQAFPVKTHGLKALPQVLLNLVTQPRLFFKLVKELLTFKWPNLEILGENLWALAMGITLAPQFKKDKIEVIYAPWPRGTATTALVIHKLTGIPYVTAVRGDNLQPADPDLALKLKEAALIRTNNLADLKRIQAFSKDTLGKVRLIYNGLTLKAPLNLAPNLSSSNKSRPFKIMALGRFDVTKGFDILISACKILEKQNFSFHLTLAGGGGVSLGLGRLEGELKAQTKNLGLEEYISFPGLIDHNQLPEILQSHDLFVAPCVIDKEGRRDGIPNTLIEAMSLGLPVVASNIHALPEIVIDQKTGLTVPEKDPKALAQAIYWMASHPKEAEIMGIAGKHHVEKLFNPNDNCLKLANLFKEAQGAL